MSTEQSTADGSFKRQPSGFSTKAIHKSQEPEQWNDWSLVAPLITSTVSKHIEPNKVKVYDNYRKGNPTRNVLEKCLASLDNSEYGLVFATGMAALVSITQLFKQGDHIISSYDVIAATCQYFTEISTNNGIEIEFVDIRNIDAIKQAIKGNTKMIWMETPTNPCMVVIDIEAVCKIAHENHDVVVVVDNTFMTSYLQRPLELGADIVMYSVSKYMNGHSDIAMGAAVTKTRDLYERLKYLQCRTIPSPFDCYQVTRSLKTLSIRMRQHGKNSLFVAKFLESHKCVEKVLHPALSSHPQHELALKQCYGHSGIMSFYIKGGLTEAKKFLQLIKIITLASSLGGPETLAQMPSLMTHSWIPEDKRIKLGITDNLIRLSVGLEDAIDLINDLDQALTASQM